jgi:hypothetical protein
MIWFHSLSRQESINKGGGAGKGVLMRRTIIVRLFSNREAENGVAVQAMSNSQLQKGDKLLRNCS